MPVRIVCECDLCGENCVKGAVGIDWFGDSIKFSEQPDETTQAIICHGCAKAIARRFLVVDNKPPSGPAPNIVTQLLVDAIVELRCHMIKRPSAARQEQIAGVDLLLNEHFEEAYARVRQAASSLVATAAR